MIVIDSNRQSGGRALDPRNALSMGELQCDNLPALLKFESAFNFGKDTMQAAALKFADDNGSTSVRMSQVSPFIFRYLLETAFVGGTGAQEGLQFHVLGHGAYGVIFDDESVEVFEGVLPAPSGHVVVSEQALGGMALFKAMLASAEANESRERIDQAVGRELSDAQLAFVAGGKGSSTPCYSDSCGGDILVVGCRSDSDCGGDILVVGCRDDYCPGDFCAGDGCLSDYGCSYNACAGDGCLADGPCGTAGCAADACGAAGCGGNACGQATCAGDACAGDACYWDACGAAACGAAACGGNYCPNDYCGADACGLDTPIDLCTVDACAVDINPF